MSDKNKASTMQTRTLYSVSPFAFSSESSTFTCCHDLVQTFHDISRPFIGECRSNRNSLSRTFDPTVSNIPTSPLPLRRSQRLGRVDESRATTSTHPALCSRPGETKGPLEAVSIHYRPTSLPRFVAVAGEVPKRKANSGQSPSSHSAMSLLLPHTHDRQKRLIAFSGELVGG